MTESRMRQHYPAHAIPFDEFFKTVDGSRSSSHSSANASSATSTFSHKAPRGTVFRLPFRTQKSKFGKEIIRSAACLEELRRIGTRPLAHVFHRHLRRLRICGIDTQGKFTTYWDWQKTYHGSPLEEMGSGKHLDLLAKF
jgi:hypothetical protein